MTRGTVPLGDTGDVTQVIDLELLEDNDPYGGSLYQWVSHGRWSRAGDALRLDLANGVIVTGSITNGSVVFTDAVRMAFAGNEIRSVNQSVSLVFLR